MLGLGIGGGIACEGRCISGGHFSPPKYREKQPPEIRLCSQARGGILALYNEITYQINNHSSMAVS